MWWCKSGVVYGKASESSKEMLVCDRSDFLPPEDAFLPFFRVNFPKAYSRRSRRVIWWTAVFLFVRA